MSFFATITGYAAYSTAAHSHGALDRLQTGGWLDDTDRWYPQGQQGRLNHAPTVHEDATVLVIPPMSIGISGE